ncbi:Glutathione S-transferase 3, partial [Linum grandiflorum]
ASPFCARVKLALAVKGLEFEARQEDLFVGKSELLLSSNRIYKKFPVFLHNGNPICESTIIVSYIDEKWPSAPLLPSSPYERSQARFWADYIDKKVHSFPICKYRFSLKGSPSGMEFAKPLEFRLKDKSGPLQKEFRR